MCGIAGIFGPLRKEDLEYSISKMSKTLLHRGPDDSGVWVDEENGIALGHQRLSILDLSSAGHQPMASPCGDFVVIFNGELYNNLQLRKKLNNSKYKQSWKGHSDTETLVSAFSQWGINKTLDQLIGMFAIAVWDVKTKELCIIRDRLGEKPLYYGWSNDVFLFGSELKALRSYKGFNNAISRNVLSLYMKYMYVPSPYSIFENIYKLDPGSILRIDCNGRTKSLDKITSSVFNCKGFSIKPWYSLSDVAKKNQSDPIRNEHEAIGLFEKTLLDSIKSQMISDVPLGAFLSGGIDSSIIVALMSKISKGPIKTFTIGFEESAFNEAVYAKEVAKHLGTEHYELYVKESDAFGVIESLPTLYDEPFADSSQIPTYLLSKLARQHVKVALSGDAGDELFGGYNRYIWGPSIWNRLKWLPPNVRQIFGSTLQKIPAFALNIVPHLLPNKYRVTSIGDKVYRVAHRLKNINDIDEMYYSLVVDNYNGENIVNNSNNPILKTKLDDLTVISGINEAEHRMMLLDALTYLPDDILTKVDRASMGVGLEVRVPFLDRRVVELAWRVPLSMKIKNSQGKWLVRQVLYKYVPKRLIERPKAGFAMPVGQWIRGPMREWANALLNDSRIQHEGYFNHIMVSSMWREHLNGSHDWSSRLWAILMFQSWLDNNA